MDALDETWSSWMRDLRLGKARIMVPEQYLQRQGPGKGARFDQEQEVYATLNMMPTTGGPPQITPSQFAIRVQEHKDTALELMARIVGSAGFSAQTFGLQGDGSQQTATEVDAKKDRSLATRGKKSRYWRPELAEAIETLMMLDAVVFHSGITPGRPNVEFTPGVETDPEAQARTLQLLQQAEAISTETAVRMLHPDWEDEDVDEEVTRIQGQAGRNVVNVDTFTGDVGGNIPGGQDNTGDPTQQEPPKG